MRDGTDLTGPKSEYTTPPPGHHRKYKLEDGLHPRGRTPSGLYISEDGVVALVADTDDPRGEFQLPDRRGGGFRQRAYARIRRQSLALSLF